jgi:hypothetical protein
VHPMTMGVGVLFRLGAARHALPVCGILVPTTSEPVNELA